MLAGNLRISSQKHLKMHLHVSSKNPYKRDKLLAEVLISIVQHSLVRWGVNQSEKTSLRSSSLTKYVQMRL